MIRATERRRRSLKRDSSYLQKILRIPQNSIVARGVTNITYFSKKPENVFPKKPNYLKYFPRKILKFPVPVYQMRKLSLKDLDSVSSYSSDTVINFEINSDLEVEFKKEVRHYLEYRGIGEQQRFVDPPTLSSSEISEDTDSSFFSTQISSLTSCIPTRRDTPSLSGSPVTTKDQDSSYISLPNIKAKFPSESSLISDVEEEALQEEEEEALQEEQITEPHLSDVSCGSKLPFSHPLDRYSEHKKPNFVDIVNTSTKRSRTDLRHLFPDFSGLNFAKSIDKMNKIEDSIKALSCEEILPGEDVSDLSSVQWLPFTRGQTKFGKEVLHKGGELFKSISSHAGKMKKTYRPPSSDSNILVKDSGSGLSPDALEDHRKRPVVRYNFKLDGILSEEAMLKNCSKAKGKISELSLNTILGIY